MKKYPLRIEEVDSDTNPLFSRGHHDKAKFAKACRSYGYERLNPDKDVFHDYWRCDPPNVHPSYDVYYVPGTKGERGSFPVTVIGI